MANVDEIDHEDGLQPVMMPSGALFHVHEKEVAYINERSKRYTEQNKFVNISDQQDLDRLLIMETLSMRWSNWISQQRDYWGDAVDTDKLQRALSDTSRELRQIKKSLGVDKETRDRQRGEGSVADYLENLRLRAKEFGYARNKQLDKALELFNELKALIILMENCDEAEQREQHCTPPEVLKWISEVCIPAYDAVDAELRENQRLWIRKL